jgi:DMSO/TMAO reductase YedYZ molybdopterin-dependent catalytic subunit
MDTTHLRTRAVDALPALLVSVLAGVAGVVGSYAVAGFTPRFVVAPVSGLFARRMPDMVIRYAITVLGSLGQKLNLLTATLVVVTAIATLAGVGLAAGRRLDNRAVPVVTTTVGTWALATVMTGDVLLSFAAAIPAGAVLLLASGLPALTGGRLDDDRRTVLATGAAVLGFSAAGYVLGERVETPEDLPRSAQLQRMLESAEEKSLAIGPDNEPLVSGNFYQVDINAIDPTVDSESWSLSVTGAVDETVTVDLADLKAMEPVDRFETLRCVGDDLNGPKMDNALWTGVPVMDVVERAGPDSDCGCVRLHAADDYYQVFPVEAMEDGLLAYGMNGMGLPRGHGRPVRALVPGHWGEIQVKWLTEIELLDRDADGYWEQRGWHGTGPVETVAKLWNDGITDLEDGRKQLGGHAYAGTRGIEQVEVSTDGGSTWTEAELSDPLGDADVWRQWRHVYDPPDGAHEVVVRATDGTGTLQPREESGSFPSGATGWVSKTVE